MQQRSMAQRARKLSEQKKSNSRQFQRYKRETKQLRDRMRQTFQQQSANMQRETQSLRSRLVNYWTGWLKQLQQWNRHLRSMEIPPRFVAQFDLSMEPLDQAIKQGTNLGDGLAILTNFTRRIGSLSGKFPREILQLLPEQQQQFQQTLNRVKNRRIRSARSDARRLTEVQTDLILKLLEWSPQSPSGGQSSPSESGQGTPSMSQLLRQQRRLSQGMMPMFNEKNVSSDLARKLFQQQQMIRKGMQQLAQQQEQNEEILGDLKQITRDMERSEEKMKNREFDRTLQARQEAILDRMEQATRSLSDDEGEREPRMDERQATSGQQDTAPFQRSEYQKVLDRLEDSLRERTSSERETILRFYRFWYQPESAGRSEGAVQ